MINTFVALHIKALQMTPCCLFQIKSCSSHDPDCYKNTDSVLKKKKLLPPAFMPQYPDKKKLTE